jgi:hypothetical protein
VTADETANLKPVTGPVVPIRDPDPDVPGAAQWMVERLAGPPGTIVDATGLDPSGAAITLRAFPATGLARVAEADAASSITELGFHHWKGFLDPEAVVLLRALGLALIDSTRAVAFPTSTRVWDVYRHGQPFLDLLLDPRLRALFDVILGEHHLISDYSLNSIQPGQPGGRWHLDYPYNQMQRLPEDDGCLGLQAILALDPFTRANGATELIPLSHRPPRSPDEGADDAALTTFIAEPGDLLVLAAATWHRSGTNTSSGARCAVLISAVPRWVRPMNQPPTDDGPWAATATLRIMLGAQAPPDTLDGVEV